MMLVHDSWCNEKLKILICTGSLFQWLSQSQTTFTGGQKIRSLCPFFCLPTPCFSPPFLVKYHPKKNTFTNIWNNPSHQYLRLLSQKSRKLGQSLGNFFMFKSNLRHKIPSFTDTRDTNGGLTTWWSSNRHFSVENGRKATIGSSYPATHPFLFSKTQKLRFLCISSCHKFNSNSRQGAWYSMITLPPMPGSI